MRAIKSKLVRAEFCEKMKKWPNNEPMSMLQFKVWVAKNNVIKSLTLARVSNFLRQFRLDLVEQPP